MGSRSWSESDNSPADMWNSLACQIFIRLRSPSDGWESAWKKSKIVARSNRNRGAIEPRSWLLHGGITSTIFRRQSLEDRDHDRSMIVARSWCNHGPIAARSWPDRGGIVAHLKQNCVSIHGQSGSHDVAPRNHFHDPCKSLPRPLQLATIFGLIFPLKTHVFSLCSSTFNWFVKKLSKFRGRSLVHRDPPRLDSIAKQLERD